MASMQAAGIAVLAVLVSSSVALAQAEPKVERWETGVVITKNNQGKPIKKSFKYPIVSRSLLQPVGDNNLCWDWCKKVCDGYGICWVECFPRCSGGSGEGDPRPR